MAAANDHQNQWEAFLKLVQVREPKLFDHLKSGRVKEMTKYNLVLYARTADDLKEMEVGLKVYHDKIVEFMPMVYGDNRGIKPELASEKEWVEAGSTAPEGPAVSAPIITMGADQNELLKVLESSIRQKVEAEIRAALQAEGLSQESQKKIAEKIKEDLEQDEENRRLAIRMTLIAEGDKILTQMVMAWQQSKQNGDGGPHWNETRQRLLELLDVTVQLTHS